jgi:sialate O-acetylesterase
MKKILLSSALAIIPLLASAELSLPEIISDNMVLQQSSNAQLWGWATPGKDVAVTTSWTGKNVVKAKADSNGRWEAKIPTGAASFDPQSITISGDGSTITLSNVLIGEVWFCSGQSNMEMPLRGFWTQPVEGAAQAIAYSGKYPGIRVATVPKRGSYTPQDKVEGSWKVSNPANAGEFTACGYFFARSLTDILNVPVGLISCAYGGSKVEGWEPADLINTYPELDLEKEKTDTSVDEWHRMTLMYNAMLRPLIGYTIKGFLWNQGESNVGCHDTYPQHFADMVARWRQEWGMGELPIYQVEIPGWNYGNPEAIDAALLREAQHKAAAITPNCGIVCTSDLIYDYELEDIHASRKQELGERLAFMAAAKTYGIEGIPCEYPTYKSMDVDGNKATLHFYNADNGFTPNDVLEGFEVAGEDMVFHPADATEIYDTRDILVTSKDVEKIVAVRYDFKNFAVGKVHNLMGLPLIPFRTDK